MIVTVNNIEKPKEKQKVQADIVKPKWTKASPDQRLEYNDVLFRKLMQLNSTMTVPSCSDIHCKDILHRVAIDRYADEIL